MFQVKRKEKVVQQVHICEHNLCRTPEHKRGAVARCWEEGPGSHFQSCLLLEVLAFGGRGDLTYLLSFDLLKHPEMADCYSILSVLDQLFLGVCLSFTETLFTG